MLVQASTGGWEAEQVGQVLLVRFKGRHIGLGEKRITQLREQVQALVEDFQGAEVVLDLSNVHLVISKEVAQFLFLWDYLAGRGLRLSLSGLDRYHQKLFQSLGLDVCLDIHGAEDDYPHNEHLLVSEIECMAR
jgi:hypothetical protein